MARPVIDLPEKFLFTTKIPVRITDVNYGGHVGNDAILSIMHEARLQFLKHFGYSEQNIGGTGMIMRDVSIIYRNELFYGDDLRVSMAVTDLSRVAFDLVYKLEKVTGESAVPVAEARTGMVCFDYARKKVVSLPDEVKQKWT